MVASSRATSSSLGASAAWNSRTVSRLQQRRELPDVAEGLERGDRVHYRLDRGGRLDLGRADVELLAHGEVLDALDPLFVDRAVRELDPRRRAEDPHREVGDLVDLVGQRADDRVAQLVA